MVVYPSCLQVTFASLCPQPEGQMYPQEPSAHISTKPSLSVPPFTSLMTPSEQLSILLGTKVAHVRL